MSLIELNKAIHTNVQGILELGTEDPNRSTMRKNLTWETYQPINVKIGVPKPWEENPFQPPPFSY